MDPNSFALTYINENRETQENPITIRVIKAGSTKPNFKKKPKRKNNCFMPLFKIVSESETDISPAYSKEFVTLPHDPCSGVYQDDNIGF